MECDHVSLTGIPLGIPANVEQLSLQGSQFDLLRDEVLSEYTGGSAGFSRKWPKIAENG